MSTFCHPAFPDITHTCPDDQDDEALAKGWVPVEEPKHLGRAWREVRAEAQALLGNRPPPPAVRK